jgi:hypothetical protein
VGDITRPRPAVGIVMHALSAALLEPAQARKLDQSLRNVWEFLGASVETGTAPPTDLERKVQRQIDDLSKGLARM